MIESWSRLYSRFRFLPVTLAAAALLLVLRINVAHQDAQKGLFVTTSFVVAEDKKSEDKKSDDKKVDDKKQDDKKSDDKKTDDKKADATPPDPLDIETQASRPSGELAVLKSLADRRTLIEKREKDLDTREAMLQAGEKQFDEKLKQLTAMRDEIKKLLDATKTKESEDTKRLVDVYEKMKPKEAAAIFNTTSMDVLLPIVRGMKEAKLSPILAAMQTEKARVLTALLSDKSKILPQESPDIPIPPVKPAAAKTEPALVPGIATTTHNVSIKGSMTDVPAGSTPETKTEKDKPSTADKLPVDSSMTGGHP